MFCFAQGGCITELWLLVAVFAFLFAHGGVIVLLYIIDPFEGLLVCLAHGANFASGYLIGIFGIFVVLLFFAHGGCFIYGYFIGRLVLLAWLVPEFEFNKFLAQGGVLLEFWG